MGREDAAEGIGEVAARDVLVRGEEGGEGGIEVGSIDERTHRQGRLIHFEATQSGKQLLVLYVATSKPADRIPRLTAQALEELEDSIAATQLTQHIDTLTRWRYLDPQVNDKILAVNAFIYDYADAHLTDCTERERTEILIRMLDRWQT